MTVLRRWMKKIARTVSVCPISSRGVKTRHRPTYSPEDDTPTTSRYASAINTDDTPTSGGSKRKFICTTLPQRKKGQSEGASLLASSMENLASSVKLQQ
ncbi:hypothetical protein LOK49_LG10G00170 [Camellia lanceoleosa]|uniref:Uncharacterized protein n=1 Tax=Camellia lanceoleosa TaxID=1840588 RepID=A0ACC0G8J9_9ERIC|nr:hypothetical protein LOK49_LG10G00170 [Camellia lanceoleosa]